MSNDMRDESGPLRHFRIGRRAVLTSLAGGVGAAVFSSSSAAAHVHHAAASAVKTDPATAMDSKLLFLDQHAFDTLSLLSDQIVPGARAAGVPEVLDRLLSVESVETQKHFTQALGAFEREAREAQGKPWKSLTAAEATASLTKVSALPAGDGMRQNFDDLKRAIAETYYSTEPGMKEMGWTGNFAFSPPSATCS